MPTTTFTDAPLIVLGDKVVTDINAETWTPSGEGALSFVARRVYRLVPYGPTDTDLHVDILVAELDTEELADRAGMTDRNYVVAIGVQQVLDDKDDTEEIDELVSFAEALRSFYALEVDIDLGGGQAARCVKRETPVIYSPRDLDESGRFFSVVHLTFQGWYVQPVGV